ncbi:hypothetical protein GCM10022295_28140 [Streptomyces osmaniensis]|uniref:Secreted protein n=1 Tax=Streptomyces osmaniensis TaxID=593134 RepID=A0ABP6W2U0_9ACTN
MGACLAAAGSSADAAVSAREATRQTVPMIAVLLVRTLTVFLLEAVNQVARPPRLVVRCAGADTQPGAGGGREIGVLWAVYA